MPTLRAITAMLGLALAILGSVPGVARAAPEGGVVASIKPVHSLVAMVMQGIGTPHLIVDGAASPHTYSLKPSDARRLQEAAAVFWVGPGLEPFLVRPLETLGGDARRLALATAPGVETIALEPDEAGHGDDAHGHGHDGTAIDMHVWLDPANARAMLHEIAAVLTAVDPANAARYRDNAAAAAADLDDLEQALAADLAPLQGRAYVVFHDAYGYFERRFGLRPAAAVVLNPETPPGARRVARLRDTIQRAGAVCAFAEPQFEPRLLRAVIEGTDVRLGVLDPLGADLPAGPAHYTRLLRGMAKSLKACLAGG